MARQFMLKREAADLAIPHYTIQYAESLNPQQLAVVQAGGGAILVIAGAGTGKTRTLIYRVAWLIENGVLPEEILLLTFTRRAARQMLDRVGALLDNRADRVRGGTFHAWCLQVLQKYAQKIGYPQPFNILDASDAADVLDVLRATQGLHQSKKRFPKKETIHAIFSMMVNREMSIEEVLSEAYPQHFGHIEVLQTLHGAYQVYKKQHGLMDYDDLLSQTVHLFEQFPDVLREVSARIRHVLVDEYQDTNRLQARLVAFFQAVHGNLMAVGDDAQSIYRFRGADFRNIMGFQDRFPNAQLLKLEQNYRSTQHILNIANYVLMQAQQRYEKRLFTEKQGGELPAIVQAPDDRFQSRFVCQMILQLREEGVPLNEMAVLFRNSRDSYDLELELSKRQIPFIKYGGLKLNDTAHVKDVLAHLKVAENPRDVVAWQRILLLLEGIGPRTAQEVMQWILAAQDPFLFDQPYASKKYIEGLRRLAQLLQVIRQPERTVSQQVEQIIQYYDPILERLHQDDHEKRRQDLQHFIGITLNYRSRGDLLNAMALEPIETSALEAEASVKDEAPLVLSTIHSAKGLEFHSVFLIQMLEGILPSAYALNSGEALDEELRLLYVGLTRAAEHLFLSYPVLSYRRSYGGDYFSRPSRFLDHLPSHLAEPWQLVEESPQAPALNATPPPSLRGKGMAEADDLSF